MNFEGVERFNFRVTITIDNNVTDEIPEKIQPANRCFERKMFRIIYAPFHGSPIPNKHRYRGEVDLEYQQRCP